MVNKTIPKCQWPSLNKLLFHHFVSNIYTHTHTPMVTSFKNQRSIHSIIKNELSLNTQYKQTFLNR